MRRFGIWIVLAGCSSGASHDTPDAADGMPLGPGMFVSWAADPVLPGPLSDKITVTDVTFEVSQFQVVGDGGADARTSHSGYELAWTTGAAPRQERFPDAPVGVYSKMYLAVKGTRDVPTAYLIHGTWRDQGKTTPFLIEDFSKLTVEIDCNKSLAAGATTAFPIRVDLRNAITGVDFSRLDLEDGVLELHGGPELDRFRDNLQHGAFRVDN